MAAKTQVGAPWDVELVRRIGFELKKARGTRSARWLSDRTEELGLRISPSVIARLDRGRRANALSVPELLVLAAALDMPPALLMFPGYPDAIVEHLPGRDTWSKDAVEWVSGAGLLPMGVEESEDGEPYPVHAPPNIGVKLVAAVRNYRELLVSLSRVAELARGSEGLASLNQVRRETNARLAELSDRIAALQQEYGKKGTQG